MPDTGNNPKDVIKLPKPIIPPSGFTGMAQVPFFLLSSPTDIDWTDPEQRELMLAEMDRQMREG